MKGDIVTNINLEPVLLEYFERKNQEDLPQVLTKLYTKVKSPFKESNE